MTWHITEISSLLSPLPPLLPFPSVSFMAVCRIRVSAPSWEILVPEYERALVELITPAKNQSLPALSLNAYETVFIHLFATPFFYVSVVIKDQGQGFEILISWICFNISSNSICMITGPSHPNRNQREMPKISLFLQYFPP